MVEIVKHLVSQCAGCLALKCPTKGEWGIGVTIVMPPRVETKELRIEISHGLCPQCLDKQVKVLMKDRKDVIEKG